MSSDEQAESVRLEEDQGEDACGSEVKRQSPRFCTLLRFYKNKLRIYLSLMLTVVAVLAIVILKFSASRWGKVTSDCLRMIVNASDTHWDNRLLEKVENNSILVEITYLLPNGTWV